HEDFRHEKLFWADMAPNGRFAFSSQEVYCNNKGYIIAGQSLKYLCAVLNSTLITWWVRNTAATTGMGLTEWTIATVERLPIPRISHKRQATFVDLIDRILYADTDQVEIASMESTIDGLVCELYGITVDEIQAMTSK
ncbi:MAG: hypothetical protein OXI24_18670, partial [Candidatus Poribacteria bacterium]|nr:hypothetical protein [Candidatus Poribacteria bacterium]